MKRFCSLILMSLSLTTLSLTSCAYLQTHKNIEQWGSHYEGYQIETPTQVLRADGKYYLAVSSKKLRLEYPNLHDSVFHEHEMPRYQTIPTEEEEKWGGDESQPILYHRISSGTASILMSPTGYASLDTLAQEMLDHPYPPILEPKNAQFIPVRATINATAKNNKTYTGLHHDQVQQADNEPAYIVYSARHPEKPGIGLKTLSWIDYILIDVPGTIAYNIAIPLMAPFYFFDRAIDDYNNSPFTPREKREGDQSQ